MKYLSSNTNLGALYVLSRSPFLCESDWNTIIGKIAEAGVLDVLTTIPTLTDQTNCPMLEQLGPTYF